MFGYVKAKDLQQVIDSRQYWFDRAKTVGAALSEMERERDTLSKEVARLRKYEPVRDPVSKRFTGKHLTMGQRAATTADSPALRGATATFEAGKAVRHG